MALKGNKDNEIEIEDVNNTVINPGDSYTIYSCGRENASSGTEGTFDLVESSGGKFIRTFYWDCPWGSKQNKAEVRGSNSAWLVEPNGFNYDSGALGNGKLTCVYIADVSGLPFNISIQIFELSNTFNSSEIE